jgi:hypothetical protein
VLAAGLVLLTGVGAAVASQTSEARHAALPELSIGDAVGIQYQSEPSTISFQVTLSAPSAVTVTVDYATRDPDGKSVYEDDIVPAAGTLNFAPGEVTKTIDLPILPEPGHTEETDDTFFVDLSNPVNAIIARGTGVGTIRFSGDPKPGQVNIEAIGDRGQCVQTASSLGCSPLTGETQLEIKDIRYVNPGTGVINLHSIEGKGDFYGTPFSVSELDAASSGVNRPVLVVQLQGGNFDRICRSNPRSKAAAGTRSTTIAHKGKKPVRRLFGNGKGRFRTKGRYSAGTVRGTYWLTTDRCDGTLTHVYRGVVSVHDFVLKKYVKVRAGHSYLASPSKKK